MGHQILQRLSAGACHLTQCSCGRGALKIKDKIILLSSSDIMEIAKLFSALVPPAPKSSLPEQLNRLTGGLWTDFSVPQE